MLIDIILGGLEQPPHVKLVYNNICINNYYYIRKDAKGFFLTKYLDMANLSCIISFVRFGFFYKKGGNSRKLLVLSPTLSFI